MEPEWWSQVPASVLTAALTGSTWRTIDGTAASNPYLLRVRQPVPTLPETYTHSIRYSVLWAYGGKGAFPPSPDEEARMNQFEQDLRSAAERDELAFLMTVLTFDGSRHWVFYTSDGYTLAHRVTHVALGLHNSQPYPIEMVAENDDDWSFVRKGIFSAHC